MVASAALRTSEVGRPAASIRSDPSTEDPCDGLVGPSPRRQHGRLVGAVVSNGYELSTSPRILDSASEVSDDWNARIGAYGYGESGRRFPAAYTHCGPPVRVLLDGLEFDARVARRWALGRHRIRRTGPLR